MSLLDILSEIEIEPVDEGRVFEIELTEEKYHEAEQLRLFKDASIYTILKKVFGVTIPEEWL